MTVIDEALLATFRPGPCEMCGRPGPTEPHHVFARGLGGGWRLDIRINLIAICRVCHDRVHWGKLGTAVETRDYLLGIVAERERSTRAALEEEIYRLRREVRLGRAGTSSRDGGADAVHRATELPAAGDANPVGPGDGMEALQDAWRWDAF